MSKMPRSINVNKYWKLKKCGKRQQIYIYNQKNRKISRNVEIDKWRKKCKTTPPLGPDGWHNAQQKSLSLCQYCPPGLSSSSCHPAAYTRNDDHNKYVPYLCSILKCLWDNLLDISLLLKLTNLNSNYLYTVSWYFDGGPNPPPGDIIIF